MNHWVKPGMHGTRACGQWGGIGYTLRLSEVDCSACCMLMAFEGVEARDASAVLEVTLDQGKWTWDWGLEVGWK